MKARLLITDRFSLGAQTFLQTQDDVETRFSAAPQPTPEELRETQGLLIRSRTKITAELLARAPDLKLIITATSGFDHIDFEATRARAITVMYTPEANARSACELTWALVLACARRVPEAHRAVKGGEWSRDRLLGLELAGKTYGIFGLGRIGSKVARVAQAFGMKVIAFDPFKDEEYFDLLGVQRMGFQEVLKSCDVLSLHVPSTPDTHRMLHRGVFEYVNRGIILVNTSRGSVIHEPDLCEAIENGWFAAVGLDVFEKEPLPRNSPLLQFPNVVFAPHLGATTHEAFAKASQEAAEKAVAFFRQGAVRDPLPPPDAWYSVNFIKSP